MDSTITTEQTIKNFFIKHHKKKKSKRIFQLS